MNGFIKDFLKIIRHTSITVKDYMLAQLKLMILVFIFLSLGLNYIGAPLPYLIALVISILDLLPVIGSGFVMLPWAIISLIQGKASYAINIAILYLVLAISKQIIEPIIVGRSIGLRPLYTFLSTIIGSFIFGPTGVILGPIIAILLNTIYFKKALDGVEDISSKENNK